MPRPYPPEFRRRALDLVESGRTIREVAASLGIAESCLHRWRHRDLVDRGLKPGTTARESEELAAARQRIRDLEEEVKILRKAAAVVLSGLGATGAGVSATARGAGQPASDAAVRSAQAAAVPGTQLWVQRYNGPGNGYDAAWSVAASPTGDKVFVTGNSTILAGLKQPDYATVAYSG